MLNNIVIIGGGQAAIQATISLRNHGFGGNIHLCTSQAHPPYHRPPLSKSYILNNDHHDAKLYIKPIDFYQKNNINLHLNCHITAINRDHKHITDNNHQTYAYDKLIIATGTRPKQFNVNNINIPTLRGLDDAQYIKNRINDDNCQHITIIGAGFIGLELAANAIKLNKKLTIIEREDRILKRAIQPELSAFLYDYHQHNGVDIMLNTQIENITKHDDGYDIMCADGKNYKTDLLINATGVIANNDIAQKAGLPCDAFDDSGIMVDAYMRTLDRDIYAIGDIAQHANPYAGRVMRLESVQNAIDQAKIAAHNILCARDHDMMAYDSVPWFWSDQGDLKIQMAGISNHAQHSIVVGNMESHKFSIYYFAYNRFIAMDSINQPAHYLAGRKILEHKLPLTAHHLQQRDFNPKNFIKQQLAS